MVKSSMHVVRTIIAWNRSHCYLSGIYIGKDILEWSKSAEAIFQNRNWIRVFMGRNSALWIHWGMLRVHTDLISLAKRLFLFEVNYIVIKAYDRVISKLQTRIEEKKTHTQILVRTAINWKTKRLWSQYSTSISVHVRTLYVSKIWKLWVDYFPPFIFVSNVRI